MNTFKTQAQAKPQSANKCNNCGVELTNYALTDWPTRHCANCLHVMSKEKPQPQPQPQSAFKCNRCGVALTNTVLYCEKCAQGLPVLPQPQPQGFLDTDRRIAEVCDELKEFLLEKNRSYGDSVANPLRVFSKLSPEASLWVRIDDKLSRIARGSEFQGDDTIKDLTGYLILLLALRKNAKV